MTTTRNRLLPFTEALQSYVVAHGVREHPVLAELRRATDDVPHAGMQIGQDQGAFMALLVKLLGARRTIEVGVYTGYSSLAVALALPSDGKIIACDISEEWTAIARRHWEKAGVAGKVDLRLGRALDTLDALVTKGESGRFDFAFIDADKKNYLAYYERCLALLRPGGLIAVDNTLWSGAVLDAKDRSEDTEAIRAFNDAVHRDERVDVALLTVGDGLTLARKR
ncbi:MAG TPA: class I SAM-dependent methyltransferase [Usitatibacter sp.]|jgi:caffeoyl-CoA O-methyltransferase|nr:class I SAM-dependent methyltransferase [Usitatibacter sp.]